VNSTLGIILEFLRQTAVPYRPSGSARGLEQAPILTGNKALCKVGALPALGEPNPKES